MSDVVDEKTLLECFRDPKLTATDEERALRLLSRHPHPERVKKIRVNSYSQSSLLHYACRNGWYDVSRELVDKCQCDPHLKNSDGDTPLHYACEGGSIDIVRFLIVDHHCDLACRDRGLWGGTPLHWACRSGKLDIVKFLVEECHCDPFRGKDDHGCTPFHLAARRKHDGVLLFLLSHIPPLKLVNSVITLKLHSTKLLETFIKCRTEYPLESAFKIFVLGNHAAGKSTLVKVIENEITSFFGSFGGQLRNVSKSTVVLLTAGIIPVSIESRRLGQIVIYDMAGHYQYYSSHAALLRSLVSSSTGMFLVVVSLNQEKEKIIHQLQYWNSFVDNCCSSAGRPLTVAVFSHADEVVEDKPERKSSEIVKGLAHSEASSSFSEVVTLDCRKLASGGLTKISKIVAGCCAKFRKTFQFDFAVQLLYAFISSRLADRTACTVSELQSLIKQEQGEDSFALKTEDREHWLGGTKVKGREYLPINTTELSQHLTTLSVKGQFIFLRNAKKVEDSWVVIDKAVLLSEVNGTIFAPDNFKQHHKIANSTGVVPFSKIREVFSERDPDMVVAFLQHLEFCQEISEAEVSLISSQHFRCNSGPVERFFFFPALVSEERPSGAGEAIDTPSYKCGWTLQCSRPHQFLTPQFLHVLLLRLAFSFALAHDDDAHKAIPVLERKCFVWKNGIHWLRNGIKTTVEVIEQNTAVSLTISCHMRREMECVKHRSQVIKCILEAKKELCPAVTMTESLIHPSCLTTPATGTLFSLSQLVRALLNNELELVSQSGEVSVEIDQLLYFEPYTCFSADVLRKLVDKSEDNSDERVSEAFLNAANKTFHAKMDQCKRDQPEYQCKLVFQVWKESTQSPTYGALRSALDKYSVFCGRNPLELAGVRGAQVPPDQLGLATSPNVQEADECVAGATVSLDELTVQPDFPYNDSELSDDDTGSDSTARSTLPQTSWESVDGSTVLGEGDLRDVISAVTSLAGRWKDLGISLGVCPSELDTILTDNPHFSRNCLREMLSQWLRQSYNVERFGEPTWRRLVESVEDSVGGNDSALAQKIARQHLVSEASLNKELAGVRGAQVPPDQPGLATSPNVQEADECVAGATVSLDEPDFPYDDSELSDDDTGSDPPAQSTLPQRTDQPKLNQLQKLKGRGGRTVKVIEQVAPVWEQLACSLHFQPAVIRTIDRKNHYQCDLACMDMFGHWLEGSARQPVSWETLMAALRDSGERDLEKLATVLDAALL